jgi:hypothetical protein
MRDLPFAQYSTLFHRAEQVLALIDSKEKVTGSFCCALLASFCTVLFGCNGIRGFIVDVIHSCNVFAVQERLERDPFFRYAAHCSDGMLWRRLRVVGGLCA